MKLYKSAVCALTLFALSFAAAPAFVLSYFDAARETTYRMEETISAQDAQEELMLIAQAITSGLITLEAHQRYNNMTDDDKQIIHLLEVSIPQILNKIKTNSSEVNAELTPVCQQLAELIVANQNLYPAPKNWQQAALFTINYAKTYTLSKYIAGESKLNDNAAEVLSAELMAQMEQAAQGFMQLMQ